jgi:SH3-like domain-containing protein
MRAMLAAVVSVVPMVLLLAATSVQAQDFRTVGEAAIVLYDAPSAKSKKLFIVNQGYPLEVLVVVEGWVKVRDANGALSWVDAKQLPPKGGVRTVMVKAPIAQVRQSADESAAVTFQAQQSVILDLIEVTGNGWLRVRHRDGVTGFVRANQVWGV